MALSNNLISLKIPQTQSEIESRLALLKEVGLFYDEVIEIIKNAKQKNLKKINIREFKNVLESKEAQITELDRGLILTYSFYKNLNNPQIDLIKLFKLNPSNKDREIVVRKMEEELKFSETLVPYVRAKLAIRELVFWLCRDDTILFELLSYTTYYLGCPTFINRIDLARCQSLYSKSKLEKKQERLFIKKINSLIAGNTKSKKTQSGYWVAHRFFTEVKASIDFYYSIKNKKEAEMFLKEISLFWKIPKNDKGYIEKKADTSASLALGIMQNKGMIRSAEQFRKGYAKNVAHLKKTKIELTIMPEIFYVLMDTLLLEPLLFLKLEPYKNLNNFNYSLPAK